MQDMVQTPRHWLKRAIVYEIFVRNASQTGDFDGVRRRLPHMADLGVTVLWLMPIHPIGEAGRKGSLGSPYASRDHRAIDERYGTLADLRAFVNEAHGLGLRVILDWVANHAAMDNVLLKPSDPFFVRRPDGTIPPADPHWTDVIAFDHQNPEVRRYLIESMLYWVAEAGIDGFRCDVAGRVPLEFWLEAREALERQKPDIGMLAESYREDHLERAFELCYDTPGFGALCTYLKKGRRTDRIWTTRERFHMRFPEGAERMTFIENHDQARAATAFGPEAALCGVALLMAFEGAPLIYAGQEIGSTAPSHRETLFEHHPIDWANPVPGFYDTAKRLVALRRAEPALRDGTTHPLTSCSAPVLAWERRLEGDRLLAAVNMAQTPMPLCPADAVEGDDCPLYSAVAGAEILSEHRLQKDPQGRTALGPRGWLIARLPS